MLFELRCLFLMTMIFGRINQSGVNDVLPKIPDITCTSTTTSSRLLEDLVFTESV